MKAHPTQERLKELLTYDPETGIFVRNTDQGGGIYAGMVAGTRVPGKIPYIRLDGRMYIASRLAWLYMTGEWPPNDVDHEDVDFTNNRWKNLRLATRSQNCANKKLQANNKTGYKGVMYDGHKWIAQTKYEGRKIYMGRFSSPEAAHAAYCEKMIELHGEYARLS